MILRSPQILVGSESIEEYVRKELLSPNISIDPRIVLSAHQILVRWIANEESCFLVRKQKASGPTSVRGVMSTEDGHQRTLVYTDNSPPVWLHNQLLMNTIVKDFKFDLCSFLKKAAVPVAFSYKASERELNPTWPTLAKGMKFYPPLWTAGWKLSHIFSCSPKVGDTHGHMIKLRDSNREEFQRIRFIRNMSPFNYFLSPMKKRFTMQLDGKSPCQNDLGEDDKVIEWVIKILHDELFAKFPEVQGEFKKFLSEVGFLDFEKISPIDGRIEVRKKTLKIQENSAPVTRHAKSKVLPTIAVLDLPQTPQTFLTSEQLANFSFSGMVYEVNQNVSRESFEGILVAPDDKDGGHHFMKDLKVGDIIFHNVEGLSAVSIVEEYDKNDARYRDYVGMIESHEEAGQTWALYRGKHFTIPDHKSSKFLTSMVRTIKKDFKIKRVTGGQGYLTKIPKEKILERKDVMELVLLASSAFAEQSDEDI